MILVLRPWTVKAAIPFVREVHRRLPRVQGAMVAIRVCLVTAEDGVGPTVGVALIGAPARALADRDVLAVSRVAVIEGYRNACSMLYGASSRTARGMGAAGLVTYTHADEHGTSLRASAWIDGGMTRGGEHSRYLRPRAAAVDAGVKRRWWAPWTDEALWRDVALRK